MKAYLLEKPHYDEKGFDNNVFDETHRMFGVFDGMGVSEGARGASALVANLFFKHRSDSLDATQLGGVIDDASRAIAIHFPNDGTTATVARVDSNGWLHYAHVGDSRLYVLKNGRIKQITADEGIGNKLANYCGPYTRGCVQAGYLEDDEWDAFMLCSDGVTGDWKEQRLSDEFIEGILKRALPKVACELLVKNSKKDDDKTVIVVQKEHEKES